MGTGVREEGGGWGGVEVEGEGSVPEVASIYASVTFTTVSTGFPSLYSYVLMLRGLGVFGFCRGKERNERRKDARNVCQSFFIYHP